MVYTTPLSYKNQQQRSKTMKINNLFLVSILLLTGCQLPDQKTHQQQEICKSLAEGYLKIQNRQGYELWKLKNHNPQTKTDTVELTYKKPNENGVVVSASLLSTVVLECTRKEQQIVMFIPQTTGESIPVLEVQVPPTSTDTQKNLGLVAQTKIQ